ncbi:MAG TPA: DNA translocase FtsK [Spirochaetota bacterium]|nr:DNA translocase FtsK [Spirochaetota bacterium]HOS31685.1 DNA translocase FtsK [Spirochaetota bacterium]HOS54981.1 DNA translocase FtsK [Spirochaetota bacterium]HPK61696.1 DNA translocase FtsK [Spirochaetota bacterium]HQF78211.1 DNA translocase FtsK [Spirochaetota bacterium]
MINKKAKFFFTSITLLISIAAIISLVDSAVMNSKYLGEISNKFEAFIYGQIGSFGILLFSFFIIISVIPLLKIEKNVKIYSLIGLSILMLGIPPFFEYLQIGDISGGLYGIKVNELINKSGRILPNFIYIAIFFFSFFLFLFPYRYGISQFVLNLTKFNDEKIKKQNKNKFKYTYVNDIFENNRVKNVKKENIPWLSKVIYENSTNRVEKPVFPKKSDVKPKKFVLKQDKKYELYEEVDTFSGRIPNKVYEEIKNSKIKYYDKVKETWPENWKGENKNYPVLSDKNRTDYILVDDADYRSGNDDNPGYDDKKLSVISLSDKIDSSIADFEEIQTEQEIDCADCVDDAEEIVNVDFDKIFENNFDNTEEEFNEEGFYSGEAKNFENEKVNKFPDMDMLNGGKKLNLGEFHAEERESAVILEETLKEFGINAKVVDIIHGPVVTLFKINPAPGVKLSKIESLSNNLALRLAAQSIRIIAPIPGEKVVGIEIPNRKREIVNFKEIVNSKTFSESKYNIPIGLGKDIYGNIIVVDLYKMPHILIAGATGAGKSVCVNSFICSILFSKPPEELKMIFIDPKIVELKPYNDIPHLLCPVITDSKEALIALKYLLYEMERRYSLLDEMGVRDIVEYRSGRKTKKAYLEDLPFIVAFIDEFADLMTTSGKEAEILFARLAAKARAVGILLVLATQRPSSDVITGLIKANIPARIAFQVISLQDSRIIMDQKGAEKLLGQGDMLYLSPTQPFPIRIQGAYLSKEEVDLIADHWKKIAEPNYIDLTEAIKEYEDTDSDDDSPFSGESKDPLFDQALEIVYQMGKASASYLQRRLNIGYNRAARIVEEMEEMGIVGPQRGAKPRELIGSAVNFDK